MARPARRDGRGGRRRGRWRAAGPLILVACLSLVASACGARLSPSQIAALNASPTDGGTGVVGGTGSGITGTSGSAGLLGSSGAAGSTGATTAGAAGASATGGSSAAGTAGAAGGSSGAAAAAAATPATNTYTDGLTVDGSVCRGPASGPGVSSSEVQVGTVTTLTGPVPGLFQSVVYGVQAWAAYMNSQGGICGRKVVDDAADDDLDASQNATATQSLAGSVLAFVGSFSGVDQGGATVLASDGVPDIGEALSSQAYSLPNNFSPSPLPCGINLAPYQTLKQRDPGAVTKMAVLSLNAAADTFETQCEMTALQSIGYKFVYQDLDIPLTETDFSTDAEGMKSAGAEGLLFVATPSYYAEVARALQDAGVTLQLPLYSANAYDPQFIPDAGSAANGTIMWAILAMYDGEDASWDPTIALFDKWYSAVSGGQEPSEYGAWGWMSGMLFVEGLNDGGGLNRTDLLNGLKQVTSFTGGGMESPADPAAKKPPLCYLLIDVSGQKFVRDPSDPSTGMNCTNAPDWDYVNG